MLPRVTKIMVLTYGMDCLCPPCTCSDCNIYGDDPAKALPSASVRTNANGGTDSINTLDTRASSFACYAKDAPSLVRGAPCMLHSNALFGFLFAPRTGIGMHACTRSRCVCGSWCVCGVNATYACRGGVRACICVRVCACACVRVL